MIDFQQEDRTQQRVIGAAATFAYAALVLPGLVTSYNIFLTKQFFSSIPTSLLESAKLDGCSQPKIFTHIVLPLSKTILAVLSINTFPAGTTSSGPSWSPPKRRCIPFRSA